MASVQFYGVDQVLNAAEARKCAAWAIFVGRSLFMKFEENDMEASVQFLEKALEMLQQSDAIYTLKFFEHEGNAKLKINEKSVCDGGSFNFKVIEPSEREARQLGYLQNTYNRELENRIKELEARIADDSDDDDEPETMGSIFLNLLKNPDQLAKVVNISRAALGLPVQDMGSIGTVEGQPYQPGPGDPVQRMADALDTLEKYDPDLVNHLEKLASVAKNDTAKFNSIISMIGLL